LKTFKQTVRTRDFAISAECFLKPETNAEFIRIQADLLRDAVDGVLLTENRHGQMHLSTLAASRLFIENAVDPIMQLGCRNRNRIVLISELLGAAALGVSSLQLVRGNPMPKGIEPRPKAVLDMTAKELLATAVKINEDDRLASPPDFFLGGLVTPHHPEAGWMPRRLTEKADSGAMFMVTHICMNEELLRAWMKHLVAAGITRRMFMIIGTAVLTSADDARWLLTNRPNSIISDAVVSRLEHADDPRAEGIKICVEQLKTMAKIPGVAGANITAYEDLTLIPEVIERADVTG
jgi:methylenetetrahydrofolate reductase (NADPH)